MVAPVLLHKIELIRVHLVFCAVIADGHFHRFPAVWAAEAVRPAVVGNSGIAHIAVPGLFLAEHGVHALVPGLIRSVQTVQVGDALDHHGEGVGQGLADLPHPFPGDVGRGHNEVEGLTPLAGGGVHSLERAYGRGTDFRFATSTFRHNERDLLAV